MELSRNYHLRLQEMCDCFLDTDYLEELEHASGKPVTDCDEDALKYLALAIMHTISEKARNLSFKKKKDGLRVSVKNDEKQTLPVPSPEVFARIFEIMRGIIHLEEARGELPLSLGLRNGQLEVLVSIKREEGKESLKFEFPPL